MSDNAKKLLRIFRVHNRFRDDVFGSKVTAVVYSLSLYWMMFLCLSINKRHWKQSAFLEGSRERETRDEKYKTKTGRKAFNSLASRLFTVSSPGGVSGSASLSGRRYCRCVPGTGRCGTSGGGDERTKGQFYSAPKTTSPFLFYCGAPTLRTSPHIPVT